MTLAAKTVAVIEGDDAAPEAVRPTIELLRWVALPIQFVYPEVGETARQKHGSVFPAEAKNTIDQADTTFFGSTSGSSAAALMYLRWGKQTFANVRPACYFEGAPSALAKPDGIDLVIVRENLEDLYLRTEGELHELSNLGLISQTARRPLSDLGDGKYAIKAITKQGCERVIRFAFELALRRRQQLTVTSKYNMLPQSDGLFLEIAQQLRGEYPQVSMQHYIVDDFACRLVSNPQQFDVVVMPNLYGDILSDAAAGLIGGLGMAASGCYGDNYAYFESAHGTAPDIAGRNIINPTANLLSAAMMLEYLDYQAAAEQLRKALQQAYITGQCLTPDVGGNAASDEFCEHLKRYMTPLT